MVQAVWTGSISFGLVSIPVKLYPATEPKDVRFHLYDRRTGKRVRYERVTRDEEAPTFEPEPRESSAPDADDLRDEDERYDEIRDEDPKDPWPATEIDLTGHGGLVSTEPVDAGDIVRGVELPTGDLVTVSDAELYSIAPERSRTIDIEEFVDLAEIDPVFFEKSYHVAPVRGSGAEKPYLLLLRAMQSAGMVGIGRFVLRTKPHLVAIRPLESSLALETLFFGDEVRSPLELGAEPREIAVSDREVKTAKQLIAALATEWVPEKHGDAYREELLDLLRSKRPATPAEPSETAAAEGVGDLMAALRASVEAAKRKGQSGRGRKTG